MRCRYHDSNRDTSNTEWIIRTEERMIYADNQNDLLFQYKKARRSVDRAKKAISEYALHNDWAWAFSGTFRTDYERTNREKMLGNVTKWIRDERESRKQDFRYLLVPELHADQRNWHIHGLFSEIPENDIILKNGNQFVWSRYEKRFGECCLKEIADISGWVDYITKEFADCSVGKDAHLYYCSRNLCRE